MRRHRALGTIVLACGLVTFAFGGVALAGELSKSEYLDEINSICADANEEIATIFEEAFADLPEDELPDPEEFAEVIQEEIVPVFEDALDEAEDVNGPRSTERKVKRLIDDYRDVVSDIEDDPEILLGDEDPFEEADEGAADLGLDECAQGGSGATEEETEETDEN